MLGKLIKHEFRSGARIMWSIYLGMIGLALLTRYVAMPVLNKNLGFILSAVSMLIVFVFGVAIVGLSLAPVIISAARFKQNVLGNQAYLTMTLPVSSHQLLLAKIIVNGIWYFFTGVLAILIAFLMLTEWNMFTGTIGWNLKDFIDGCLEYAKTHEDIIWNLCLVAFEGLLNIVAGVSLATIMVYMCYSIGYAANRHKSLWTVLLIYGFFHVTSWLGIILLIFFGKNWERYVDLMTGLKGIEGILGISLAAIVALSAIYYFVTHYFITRKLNLE